MLRSRISKTLVMFILALWSALAAMAQTDTARLQGTVTDPNGAVIAGASVSITNIGTERVATTTTNELGYYTVPGLQPGSYRAEVSQKDFKKTVRELELQVAQVGVADFVLQVGELTETVTVEAGSPVINPGDSAIGEVVESQQITQLPLNGRNFAQLATLGPGVTRGVITASATGVNGNAETFRAGETYGAALAVNGLRPQNNNFQLDGIDNNEALVNTIVFFPPADAIEEFKVQTSLAPAQFGRAGGAVLLTTIRSGSNSFHGSAFEFNRNTDLQARDFFNNGPTPGYNRNQFGGTLGGPIIKNKLFFFVDYQGLRKKIPGGNDTATVPTAKMRQGDFSELLNIPCTPNTSGLTPPVDPVNPKENVCQTAPNPATATFSINVLDPTTGLPFVGNIIPMPRQNTVGLAYISAFPAVNCSPAIDSRCHTIEQNYRNTRKIIENWNDFDVRADYLFNTTNSFFVRLSRGSADQTNTTRLTTLPSGFGSGTNFNHPWGASIGWTDTISAQILNEVRVGFVRTEFGYDPPFNGVPLCTQLGIVNCNTPLLGGIALIGGYNGEIEYTGDYGTYLIPQTGYNVSDTVTWSKGPHTFKFGGNVVRRQLNLYRPLAGKGYFAIAGNGSGGCCGVAGGSGHTSTGYEVSDLLAGFVDGYGHGTTTGSVGTRSWEDGFFAQDDWRVSQRLTLNLGLRYDILTWPIEVLARQANFNLATGALDLANRNSNDPNLIGNNWTNFGPRIGFAYQLTRDSKTVLRGGFGIFYFLDRGGINNQLSQNPPFGGTNSVSYTAGYRITLSGALACQPNCTQAQLISTNATAPLPSGDFTNLDTNQPTNISVITYEKGAATPMVYQYNLQLQRQIGADSSVSIAYVGDHGSHLTRNYNANQPLFGVNTGTAGYQLFPQLGSVTVQNNGGNSNYNSLQAQYEHRFHRGIQFLGSFTWSKTIDDSCGNLDNCAPQTYTNFRIERGLSNIDQNYRLVLSGLYELPIGRGKRFGHDWARPVDWALGGWQVNGIYVLQSGLPFSVCVDGNPAGNCVARADIVGSPSIMTGAVTPKFYFNTAAFVAPPTITFGNFTTYARPGNSGRNILRGPGSSNIDLSVFKNFSLTEALKLEVRGQAYNLTNTPHFGNPNADLSQGNFGVITTTVPFSYRQVELGVRLTF